MLKKEEEKAFFEACFNFQVPRGPLGVGSDFTGLFSFFRFTEGGGYLSGDTTVNKTQLPLQLGAPADDDRVTVTRQLQATNEKTAHLPKAPSQTPYGTQKRVLFSLVLRVSLLLLGLLQASRTSPPLLPQIQPFFCLVCYAPPSSVFAPAKKLVGVKLATAPAAAAAAAAAPRIAATEANCRKSLVGCGGAVIVVLLLARERACIAVASSTAFLPAHRSRHFLLLTSCHFASHFVARTASTAPHTFPRSTARSFMRL
jgi:hypothetical protein